MRALSASRKFAIIIGVGATLSAAQASAQDLFSALFGGGFERPRESAVQRMPYADEGSSVSYSPRADRPRPVASAPRVYGVGQSFCVRTCDGRFFPIASVEGNSSRVATCKNMCPSSETKVYSGSSIDSASAADNGKPYSALPNAFRFRKELVAGCTCNGKDHLGLASVKIEEDKTLRKGDIVAGANGLMITHVSDRRSASVEFTPASRSVRAQFERAPVMASSAR